jgi:hypothetical protein
MLQAFVQNVSSVPDVCCKHFDLNVTYVSHIYCNNCLVLCCSKYFHVASCKCFIWMLHMYHTYVVSVNFRCFICFRRISQSSVSCCTCFMFGEFEARGVMMAWHGVRSGCNALGPGDWDSTGQGTLAGQGERLDGWGRVKSRQTGQTARARRVIRMHEHNDGRECAYVLGRISGWRQVWKP